MIKIYFCGSIRGGRQMASVYSKIIEILLELGDVLTEHLGDDGLIASRDRILSDREIHDRDMHWIFAADVVVADVTVPSLGVGYEIGRAVEMGKPLLCLFNPGSGYTLSAMIAGIKETEICHYNEPDELRETLQRFISQYTRS